MIPKEIGGWSPSRLQRYVKDNLLTDSTHLPSPLQVAEIIADKITTRLLKVTGRLATTVGMEVEAESGWGDEDTKRIRWVTQADGSVVAHIIGQESGGSMGLTLEAGDMVGDVNKAALSLFAVPGATTAFLTAQAINKIRTIISSEGMSSFPQWSDASLGGSAAELPTQVEVGNTTVTASAVPSVDKTVNHDIGRTPAGCVATSDDATMVIGINALTSTQITFRLRRGDGANFSGTKAIYYYVWG